MKKTNDFDLIIIGAGHAGLESAFIAAKFNLRVGLFNMNRDSIANLPCNPAIGGPAKGVVTREIDALGGIQAIAADATKIQIKKLNSSKGPGVWAYRAQIDKTMYHEWFTSAIDENPNITLVLGEVVDILRGEDGAVNAVRTRERTYWCGALVVTTGTYLRAELYRDRKFAESGPDNNPASNHLSDIFRSWGLKLLRLKTGTPPRVYAHSIDFSKLEKDDSNDENLSFSFVCPRKLPLGEQMHCYLSETTEATREFIMANLERFGSYNGSICGVGPRYCPSIEDKFVRFPNRKSHHIFVEPVGRDLDYYYLAGFSTSLGEDLQLELLRTLRGFERAEIKSYAYAIVYDAIDPVQLHRTLECRSIPGLYFAGQINGTSGYEEAAAQGLMAGINASLKVLGREPLILGRNEAYIGVMIDDLTTRGVTEPYRLLTSRAEYRLLLRNDNADERLMGKGHGLGLIDDDTYGKFMSEQGDIAFNIGFLRSNYAARYGLVSGEEGPLTLFSWLARDVSRYGELEALIPQLRHLSLSAQERLSIRCKYEGYIKSQEARLGKVERWKGISLMPIDDYAGVDNLSLEAREKLNRERPMTVGDALRISGVDINDIFWIKVFLDRLGFGQAHGNN